MTVRTLPMPSAKTAVSKVESAHVLAAETLIFKGDPGDMGTWEVTSPSLLVGILEHASFSSRWGQLEKVVCSLFFLGACVREFGVSGLSALLCDALSVMDRSQDQGDDAASCRQVLILHYEFLEQHLASRTSMGAFSWRSLWNDALNAKLPGVEKCIGTLSSLVGRCRTLLATTQLPSMSPSPLLLPTIADCMDLQDCLVEPSCPTLNYEKVSERIFGWDQDCSLLIICAVSDRMLPWDADVIPIEITAQRLRRTLVNVTNFGLDFLCPDANVGHRRLLFFFLCPEANVAFRRPLSFSLCRDCACYPRCLPSQNLQLCVAIKNCFALAIVQETSGFSSLDTRLSTLDCTDTRCSMLD